MNIRKDIENILCECDQDSLLQDENLDMMIDRLEQYIISAQYENPMKVTKGILTELHQINNNLEKIGDKYLDEIAKNAFYLAHGSEESYTEFEGVSGSGIEDSIVYAGDAVKEAAENIVEAMHGIYEHACKYEIPS